MILYDLPEGEYHGQTGGTKYFGIHSLMEYDTEGPAYFYQKHVTGEIKETRKRGVYDMGSAAHSLILEGQEAYEKSTIVKPGTYMGTDKMTKKLAKERGFKTEFVDDTHEGQDVVWQLAEDGFYYTDIVKPWSGNAGECIKWIKEHSDRYILDEIEDYAVQGMHASIQEYPGAELLLGHSLSEVTIRREINTGGGLLPVQIRIDAVTLDGTGSDVMNWVGLCDYKTCESLKKFKRDVFFLNYMIQAAFYTLVVYEETGLTLPWTFLAQQKHKPYRIGDYEITDESLQTGTDVLTHLLPRVAHSINNDSWPIGHESGTI